MDQNQDLDLIKLSREIGLRSKDRSSKVGCVLTSNDGDILGFGYNGFPRGFNDLNPLRHERPEKYKWTEHAERNAIYNIARETLSDGIMLATKIPTMEGARAIVSSGIKEVCCIKDFKLINSLSSEPEIEYGRVVNLFNEANVTFYLIDASALSANEVVSDKSRKVISNLKTLISIAKIKSQCDIKDAAAVFNKDFSPIFSSVSSIKDLRYIFDESGMSNSAMVHRNDFVTEATQASIFSCVKQRLNGAKAYVDMCPCVKCGISLMRSGVTHVIARELDLNNEADVRWKDNFECGQFALKAMGVELKLLKLNNNGVNSIIMNDFSDYEVEPLMVKNELKIKG